MAKPKTWQLVLPVIKTLIRKAEKKNKKPREKKYKSADWLRAESLILEQLWLAQRPQLKRGLLQVTDTKNFHVHVGVDDYEAMPFWA